MFGKGSLKLFLVCCGLMLFLESSLNAQDEKLKAIFVYNFTRYIDWPDKPGNFIIVVLGKSHITAELNDIALKKKVGNMPIQVIPVSSAQEIGESHIVYVTSSKSAELPAVASLSRVKSIMIISEKVGACKEGSGINFIVNDSKLGFEICKTNLTACGLTVSTSLFALGTVVNE